MGRSPEDTPSTAPSQTPPDSPPLSPSSLDHLRTLKGRYRVSERHILGEGSFAKVHKGLDKKTNSNVAVKMYTGNGPKAVQHFKRTIKVWKTIVQHAEKSMMGSISGEDDLMDTQVSFERQQSFDETYVLEELKKSLDLEETCPFNDFIACLDIRRCFVQLLDYSTDEAGKPGFDESGSLWIVQEMGSGSLEEELSCRADECPMKGRELMDLLWSLVCITWGLHVCGFVHMDIKPMNIVKFTLASEDEDDDDDEGSCISPRAARRARVQWKLIDLDGALQASESVGIKSDKLVFTPVFMPPELAQVMVAKHSVVKTSRLMDVWSIGMCVMQAIFQMPALEPFYVQWKEETGSDAKFMQWLADLNGEPIIHGDMEQHIRGIDPGLCILLKHMLERDPAKRYCTARCLMHVAFRRNRDILMKGDDAIQAWMTEVKSEQKRRPSEIFNTAEGELMPKNSRSSACAVM